MKSTPLRERAEDIPLLALHFLAGTCRKLKVEGLALSEGDVARLCAEQLRVTLGEHPRVALFDEPVDDLVRVIQHRALGNLRKIMQG